MKSEKPMTPSGRTMLSTGTVGIYMVRSSYVL